MTQPAPRFLGFANAITCLLTSHLTAFLPVLDARSSFTFNARLFAFADSLAPHVFSFFVFSWFAFPSPAVVVVVVRTSSRLPL